MLHLRAILSGRAAKVSHQAVQVLTRRDLWLAFWRRTFETNAAVRGRYPGNTTARQINCPKPRSRGMAGSRRFERVFAGGRSHRADEPNDQHNHDNGSDQS